MTENKKKEKLWDNIANAIKRSDVKYGNVIGILESLKMDIILNSGMVGIDGKPLKKVKKKK